MLCSGCQGDGHAREGVGKPRAGVRSRALLAPSSCEVRLHLTVWLTLGILLSLEGAALVVPDGQQATQRDGAARLSLCG